MNGTLTNSEFFGVREELVALENRRLRLGRELKSAIDRALKAAKQPSVKDLDIRCQRRQGGQSTYWWQFKVSYIFSGDNERLNTFIERWIENKYKNEFCFRSSQPAHKGLTTYSHFYFDLYVAK